MPAAAPQLRLSRAAVVPGASCATPQQGQYHPRSQLDAGQPPGGPLRCASGLHSHDRQADHPSVLPSQGQGGCSPASAAAHCKPLRYRWRDRPFATGKNNPIRSPGAVLASVPRLQTPSAVCTSTPPTTYQPGASGHQGMGGGMTMSYRFSRLVRSAGGALISSPPYRRPVPEKLPHLLGHA